MTISVNCGECGKTLKAPDSAAGKKAKCPQCSAVVLIPEQIFDAEVVDDNESSGGDPFDDLSGEEAEDDGRKPCPMCGEMIVANAAKCRFCKEIFDPKLKKAAKKKSKGGDLDADMSTGDWVVALLCSGIGCIAGIIWMIQGKSKGAKMLGVSFGAGVFWNIVSAAIRVAIENAK